MATTTHDDDCTRLVDTLLDSLASLQRSTTPQEDLIAMSDMLLDHAADLDQDELPWDEGDFLDDEGDRAFDIARDLAAERSMHHAP